MTHFLRRQTSLLPGLAATLVLTAALADAQEAPAPGRRFQPDRIEVAVRLYNTAQVAAATLDRALAIAAHAFAPTGVTVSWKDCDSGDACSTVFAARALVLRLGRSSAVMKHASPFVLGDALINRATGSGVFATIYVDRVERMSERADSNLAPLLGRAIAHEIGHLLLGTKAHSVNGVMRGNWTDTDVRRNLLSDWMLSKKDVDAIRKRLK